MKINVNSNCSRDHSTKTRFLNKQQIFQQAYLKLDTSYQLHKFGHIPYFEICSMQIGTTDKFKTIRVSSKLIQPVASVPNIFPLNIESGCLVVSPKVKKISMDSSKKAVTEFVKNYNILRTFKPDISLRSKLKLLYQLMQSTQLE